MAASAEPLPIGGAVPSKKDAMKMEDGAMKMLADFLVSLWAELFSLPRRDDAHPDGQQRQRREWP